MDREVLDFVVKKTHELMDAASCSSEAKAAKYIAELEADIVTVDGLISFAQSEAGASVFGADNAKNIAAHAREIKAAGAKYCDCPACAAVEAILEKKELMQ